MEISFHWQNLLLFDLLNKVVFSEGETDLSCVSVRPPLLADKHAGTQIFKADLKYPSFRQATRFGMEAAQSILQEKK